MNAACFPRLFLILSVGFNVIFILDGSPELSYMYFFLTSLVQYYTDPVNGYVFRSRKDAIQYIETGQVSKYAIKPKNRNTSDLYTSKKESHVSMNPLLS